MYLTGLPRASVSMQAVPIKRRRREVKPRTQPWTEERQREVATRADTELTRTRSLLLELSTKQQARRLLRRQREKPAKQM